MTDHQAGALLVTSLLITLFAVATRLLMVIAQWNDAKATVRAWRVRYEEMRMQRNGAEFRADALERKLRELTEGAKP